MELLSAISTYYGSTTVLSLPPIELLQCYLYLLPLTTTETFIDITAIDHITRHLTHTTPTHVDLYIDILTTLHANCRPQVVQNICENRPKVFEAMFKGGSKFVPKYAGLSQSCCVVI